MSKNNQDSNEQCKAKGCNKPANSDFPPNMVLKPGLCYEHWHERSLKALDKAQKKRQSA